MLYFMCVETGKVELRVFFLETVGFMYFSLYQESDLRIDSKKNA